MRSPFIAAGTMLLGLTTFASEGSTLAATETSDSASNDSLGEIVVSAAKREGTVQNTPVSISVVGDVEIAQLDLKTVKDIEHVMPNVGFALVTGTPQLYIRGVGGGGRNVGFDPRVGVYVDGVYMGNTAALDAVLVGLERVEVLRGPQGFLFGAASDAGAISLVTKAPSSVFSEEASIAYGSHDQIDFTERLNVPIKDNIFGTLSVVRETGDGWIKNLADDGRYVDRIDNTGVRARVRIVASENTTVDFATDYSHTETGLLVGEPITGPFGISSGLYPYANYTVDQTSPEIDTKTGGGFSATVNYQDADIKLASITAYRTAHRHWETDTDHTPLNLMFVNYNDQFDIFSQEFTATSNIPSSRIRWLGGLFYSQSSESSNRLLAILGDAAAFGLGGGNLIDVPNNLEDTYSAYGSVDFDIMKQLTFDVGGRLTLDTRDLTMSQSDTTTVLAGPTFAGFDGKTSETYFLPTAGLTYTPIDNVMAYAKFSEGEKPGGYDADFVLTAGASGTPYAYSAEKVRSYETGLKTQWFDHRLTANVAAFLNNFSDYQQFQFGRTATGATYSALKNAGNVRTSGAEFEFDANPVKGLTMGLNFSRLYATYVTFPDGGGVGVSYDGHQLEYAPKWTGSFNANYTHDLGVFSGAYWIGGGNFFVRSSSYADPSNAAQYYMSGSKLLTARLGIGSKGGAYEWEASLSGENLLNSDAFNNISGDGFGILVGFREIPRRYMGKISIKF
jgi:iron complex outermembrane receptor protein